jgi:hypothetical protein
MPLTRGEGRVTGLAEGVGPGLVLKQFLIDRPDSSIAREGTQVAPPLPPCI